MDLWPGTKDLWTPRDPALGRGTPMGFSQENRDGPWGQFGPGKWVRGTVGKSMDRGAWGRDLGLRVRGNYLRIFLSLGTLVQVGTILGSRAMAQLALELRQWENPGTILDLRAYGQFGHRACGPFWTTGPAGHSGHGHILPPFIFLAQPPSPVDLCADLL